MIPTNIKGATHRFAKPENWDDATMGPCGDLMVRAQVGAGNICELVSAWKPNASELAILNAGGAVEVLLCTNNQPPMAVGVVEGEPDVAAEPRGPAITINEEAHGHE